MKKNDKFISVEHSKYLKKLKKEKITIKIWQIALLIFLLAFWELSTRIGLVDAFFVSSPSRIIKTLIDMFADAEILGHIGITLYETLIGFLIATVLGSLIAILLSWNEKLRKILDPYIVVLNSLPKIALGPIIIIWVGSGTSAIVTMCVLICIVITTLSMLSAFLSCDKSKILLMKSMKASKFQIYRKLIIPNAIPEFISVLKINVGMSWVGSIMGEYLTSKAGLGYLIVYGGQVFKLDLVMASIIILCVLAGLMYFVVSKIEAKFRR